MNTVLALSGSCVAAFLCSYLFRTGKRFAMVDIQNATLAGGVAVGATADMVWIVVDHSQSELVRHWVLVVLQAVSLHLDSHLFNLFSTENLVFMIRAEFSIYI